MSRTAYVSPALMLQPAADGFRAPKPNRERAAPPVAVLRATPTSDPPLFLPARGTAGLKLAVSRIRTFAGQFGVASGPRPNPARRIRVNNTPSTSTYPEVKQLAVMRQPSVQTVRPWWENYLYD